MAFANRQELVDRALELIANERAGRGIDRAIVQSEADSTVAWVSRYAPRENRDTINGNGTFQIALSGLSPSWVVGFSLLRRVEYPLSEQVRLFIDANEIELFPSAKTATHLHFSSESPATGTDNVAVEYTTLHAVSDTTSTVPDHEEPAFELALAASACRLYAAKYGHTTDPSLDADVVNYRSKLEEWLKLAAAFEGQASAILGVDISGGGDGGSGGGPGGGPGSSAPAGGWLDWDPQPSPYSGLIFRGSRRR